VRRTLPAVHVLTAKSPIWGNFFFFRGFYYAY
jgi:hypothetical protein